MSIKPTTAKATKPRFEHVSFAGLPLTLEYTKGDMRSGKSKDGKQWFRKMHHGYGYIRKTKGTDGEHLDVYLGPNDEVAAPSVFVVDQMKGPDFKKFDEQKFMLGFRDIESAKAGYLKHYPDARFLGKIKAMSMPKFKEKAFNKMNFGKKVAGSVKVAEFLALARPNDPRHTPPTQRGRKKKAELEALLSQYIDDFEYMTEPEKQAALGAIGRIGSRVMQGAKKVFKAKAPTKTTTPKLPGYRVPNKPPTLPRPTTQVQPSPLQPTASSPAIGSTKAPAVAPGDKAMLMPSGNKVTQGGSTIDNAFNAPSGAVAKPSSATSAGGKHQPLYADTPVAQGGASPGGAPAKPLITPGRVLGAGALAGAIGVGYTGKKVVDTGTALVDPRYQHQPVPMPRVYGQGRAF